MIINKIFYPTIVLTAVPQHVSYPYPPPTDRFFSYIRPLPCVVSVLQQTQQVSEVRFPNRTETDIVSNDYLHSVGNHEISNIVKLIKEQEDERSHQERQDGQAS